MGSPDKGLGGGEVASADGLRFVVPVCTLHAASRVGFPGLSQRLLDQQTFKLIRRTDRCALLLLRASGQRGEQFARSTSGGQVTVHDLLGACLSEQNLATGNSGLATATLKLLAGIIFRQPISQAEIDQLCDADKGNVVKLRSQAGREISRRRWGGSTLKTQREKGVRPTSL